MGLQVKFKRKNEDYIRLRTLFCYLSFVVKSKRAPSAGVFKVFLFTYHQVWLGPGFLWTYLRHFNDVLNPVVYITSTVAEMLKVYLM